MDATAAVGMAAADRARVRRGAHGVRDLRSRRDGDRRGGLGRDARVAHGADVGAAGGIARPLRDGLPLPAASSVGGRMSIALNVLAVLFAGRGLMNVAKRF